MATVLRQGRAICVVLVTTGAIAPGACLAQSPIDVPTLVTIAPAEEAPSTGAPRSSFDYETAAAAVRPWDVPHAPQNAQLGDAKTGTLAAATAASPSPRPTGFVGAAAPLACRQPAYRIILDNRSDMRAGALCVLPDGSWQLLP